MSGSFPNNFNKKIDTAVKLAANHGVLLVVGDDGRLLSIAKNRHNRVRVEWFYKRAPHRIVGAYEGEAADEKMRAAMFEDCAAMGIVS